MKLLIHAFWDTYLQKYKIHDKVYVLFPLWLLSDGINSKILKKVKVRVFYR